MKCTHGMATAFLCAAALTPGCRDDKAEPTARAADAGAVSSAEAGGAIVSGLARVGAPDRREVFALLARAGRLPLAGIASCDGVVPEVERPTLADWVSYNLSVLEGDDVGIESTCGPGEARGEWQCDVMFRARFADSPDPWSWGVRFRLREEDRSLVPGSVECLGAG